MNQLGRRREIAAVYLLTKKHSIPQSIHYYYPSRESDTPPFPFPSSQFGAAATRIVVY